jgi:hypothetical protein
MTTKRALFPAFVLAGAMFSSIATADVPPPGLQSCVNKTAGVACDMENTGGQPTGQIGVCTMTMQCGSWVACGTDGAPYPVCPDAGSVRPGYVWERSACLLCQAGDAGATDAAADSAAPTDGATPTDSAAGGAAGSAGAVVTGGAAGTAGAAQAGAAGATIGAGGAAGSAGAVALGGAAGSIGAGGSTAAGGVAGAPTEPPVDEGGGCSLGSANAKKTFGPWLLSGGVAALLLLARRRRRD